MHKLFKSGILVSHNLSTLLDINQILCRLVFLMKVSHAGVLWGSYPSFLKRDLHNCDIPPVCGLPIGSVGSD